MPATAAICDREESAALAETSTPNEFSSTDDNAELDRGTALLVALRLNEDASNTTQQIQYLYDQYHQGGNVRRNNEIAARMLVLLEKDFDVIACRYPRSERDDIKGEARMALAYLLTGKWICKAPTFRTSANWCAERVAMNWMRRSHSWAKENKTDNGVDKNLLSLDYRKPGEQESCAIQVAQKGDPLADRLLMIALESVLEEHEMPMQAVFVMHVFDGYSIREASLKLGIPKSTAAVEIGRILEKTRAKYYKKLS